MICSQNIRYQSRRDLIAAQQSLGPVHPGKALIQVFSGQIDPLFIQQLLDELADVFPRVAVIGTTTAGEIFDQSATDQEVIINICQFESTQVQSSLLSHNDDLTQCAQLIAQQHHAPDALIVFGCGLKEKRTIDATPLLNGLRELMPTTVIAGGHAGDNGAGNKTWVFTEHGISSEGFAIASLRGKQLEVNNHYNLSWVPIGQKFTINKAEGSRVIEIDGRSPYALYCHYLGKEVADSLPLSAADFPLIIEKGGVLMAIHATGVNEDGSFNYMHQFHPGEQVQFGFCHSGLLALSAQEIHKELADKPIDAAFIYSCVSRKWILGADISVEIAPVASLATTAGFFAYGEYFSHPDGSCRYFSQTMTILTLAERSAAPSDTTTQPKWSAISHEESRQLKTLKVLHRLVETSARELESTNIELATLAHKDTLTGLANRRLLEHKLYTEIARASRNNRRLTLMMIDVDHFKAYNDTYGHVAGDACLRGISQEIAKFTHRVTDLAARFGGEEFICVLPEMEFEAALTVADKIRQAVSDLKIGHRTSETYASVTVSIGVYSQCRCTKNISPSDLIEACDQQLYLAKSQGRNRVVGKEG